LFPVGEARSRSLLLRQRPLPKAVACRCITKLARQMRRRQSAQSLRMRTSRSRRRDHRPAAVRARGSIWCYTAGVCCGSARCRLCSCASSWRSQRSSSPTTRRSSSSPLLSPCPTPTPPLGAKHTNAAPLRSCRIGASCACAHRAACGGLTGPSLRPTLWVRV
jgi:hypothetical protein